VNGVEEGEGFGRGLTGPLFLCDSHMHAQVVFVGNIGGSELSHRGHSRVEYCLRADIHCCAHLRTVSSSCCCIV
jgi:hypothetical protein